MCPSSKSIIKPAASGIRTFHQAQFRPCEHVLKSKHLYENNICGKALSPDVNPSTFQLSFGMFGLVFMCRLVCSLYGEISLMVVKLIRNYLRHNSDKSSQLVDAIERNKARCRGTSLFGENMLWRSAKNSEHPHNPPSLSFN